MSSKNVWRRPDRKEAWIRLREEAWIRLREGRWIISGVLNCYRQQLREEAWIQWERRPKVIPAEDSAVMSAKDEDEVALCVKELNSPSFYPVMVSLWVMDSFERKDLERDLLAKLLVNLCKSHGRLLGHLQLIEGFKTVLSLLEDAVNDAPKAGEFLGRIFAKSVLENVCSLSELGRLIHEGGEEPGRLLEIGLASEVLGSILESIKTEKGDSVLADIRMSSNLRLEDFRPPHPMKSKKLDAFL